jgi:hemoglobin/transferrin/lactoferrin receptor protein
MMAGGLSAYSHAQTEAALSDSSGVQLKAAELDATDLVAVTKLSEQKVVSASRSSQSVKDLPVMVYVITQEQIRENGYTTLVDALRNAPGMRTSKPGSGDLGEMFLMRGLVGNRYCKILINNLPIQPSVTGALAILEQLPITQAKRIEIVYGPASSVYGSDAMAGVINIITETAEQKSAFSQASAMYGQNGYYYGSFMAGGKAGKDKNVLKYTIHGIKSGMQDLNIRYNNDIFAPLQYMDRILFVSPELKALAEKQPDVFLNQVVRSAFPHYKGDMKSAEVNQLPQESQALGVKLAYRNFQFSVDDMYRKNHSSLGSVPTIFSYANPENYTADRTRRFTLGYQRDWERFAFTANLSYLNYRTEPLTSRGTNYDNGYNGRSFNYQASDDIFFEGLGNYRLGEKTEILAGGSVQFSSVMPTTNDLSQPFNPTDYVPFTKTRPLDLPFLGGFGFNPFSYTNWGLFGQFQRTGRRLTIVAGLRVDGSNYVSGNSIIGSFAYPRVALLYKFNENLSVRYSAGTAIKIPAPDLAYSSTAFVQTNDQGQIGISYEQIPNPDLQAERFDANELGLRYEISNKILIDFSVYINRLQQPIVATVVPLDTLRYPMSADIELPDGRRVRPFVRTYANDDSSQASLVSFQVSVQGRNLIPRWQIDSDLHLTFSSGQEQLPNQRGTINRYRMLPGVMLQWRMSARPLKNLYINLEHVAMSGWIRRFVPDARFVEQGFGNMKGYYALDGIVRYRLSNNFSVFCKVINMFNTQYAGLDPTGSDIDLSYNPQLLRNIQCGVNFRLN